MTTITAEHFDRQYQTHLKQPEISGVTLRVHIESGIPEGSHDFWATVFDGVKRAGRPIGIDLHAKGVDPKLIDMALATGMPVNLPVKYLAEHVGLPYQQGPWTIGHGHEPSVDTMSRLRSLVRMSGTRIGLLVARSGTVVKSRSASPPRGCGSASAKARRCSGARSHPV